jgi:hypothetical protein
MIPVQTDGVLGARSYADVDEQGGERGPAPTSDTPTNTPRTRQRSDSALPSRETTSPVDAGDATSLSAALAPRCLVPGSGQNHAFDAVRRYAQETHYVDSTVAGLGQALEAAAVAALTFGFGRSAGNIATDYAAPGLVGDPSVAAGAGDAFAHMFGSAVGGAMMLMAAQALVPPTGAAVFWRKMTAIPAEALVPNRLDASGNALPLDAAETALRLEIKKRQKEIVDPKAVANVATGGLAFALAQTIRLLTQADLGPGGASADSPSADFTKLGNNMAVSSGGGLLLGGSIAARMGAATIAVPDTAVGGTASTVMMPLFYAAPSKALISPSWRGKGCGPAFSGGMRFFNLIVAALPLQTAAAVASRAHNPALGTAAQVAGMMVGASTYFVGQGLIGQTEAQRHAPVAPPRQAPDEEPPDLEAADGAPAGQGGAAETAATEEPRRGNEGAP